MKRKVKFQEGGAVEEPSSRSRSLRQMMEKASREGGRLRAAERARERQLAERAAAREQAASRASSLSEVARFNDRMNRAMPVTPEEARRLGAEPARPRPTMAQASQQVMRPPSPSATSTAGRVAGGLAGAAISGAALVPGMVDYGREVVARRGAEADARREANLQAFRNRQADMAADGPAAGSMQGAPTAPESSPAVEALLERLRNERQRRPQSSEGAPPRTQAARPNVPSAPRREMTADELNEMELRRIRAERQMEEEDRRRRTRREEPEGGSGNIGAASARERGEQVGPPGQYNMKKGGKVPAPKAMVKKKAGGMIAKPKAAPTKMKKGGAVAKPKGKPMPFKKGGVIKKGRK